MLGNLLKQILRFMLGLYLVYEFFRLFMRFCFYFIDAIVALAMFAFFFPFMLAFFVFKNSSSADWVKKFGDAFAPKLIKDVFNAICALAVAVIVYTIVMVIIAKFFASDMMSSNEIVRHILDGTISKDILSNDNLVNMTLMGCIIVGFIVNYLTERIPSIGKDIWAAFGVQDPDAKMGKEIGEAVETVAKNLIAGGVKKIQALATDPKDQKDEKK
jgi:ABC-type Fe3+ transport system permease subunit